MGRPGTARVDHHRGLDDAPCGLHGYDAVPPSANSRGRGVREQARAQAARVLHVPLDHAGGVAQAVTLVKRPRKDPFQVDEGDHAGYLLRFQPLRHDPQAVLQGHIFAERAHVLLVRQEEEVAGKA